MNSASPATKSAELNASLDLAEYAEGVAGEAWVLLARIMLMEGRPRIPAIASELDLSPPQAIVLRLLAEPRPMGELATAMFCDNSNITGIVDRLEERGLVERQADEHDRRVKLIAATAAGRKLRDRFNRRLATPPAMIADIPEADLRQLRDILRRATS